MAEANNIDSDKQSVSDLGETTPAPEPPSESASPGASPDTADGAVVDIEIVVEETEVVSESVESPVITEAAIAAAMAALGNDPAPPAPTESYVHPVTGREVYVPKNSKALGPGAFYMTGALMMFVGGTLVTLMMLARAFDLHGQTLVYFVIASCAGVLGLAGGLLLKTLGDKYWVGAVIGACFGTIGAILVYLQTSHHPWWH